MGGYHQLPITPFNPPDPAEQYARVVSLKNMLQMQPLQMERAQQEVQAGRMQQQHAQQVMQDRATVQSYLSQHPDANFADIANATKGTVLPETTEGLLNQHAKMQTAVKTDFDNLKSQHDQMLQLYTNVMKLPDDNSLAQQWPTIAQQYNAIPGIQQKMDPQQPLSKAQISQFGPLFQLQQSYLDAEMERRKTGAATQTAEAESRIKTAEASAMEQFGGLNNAAADAKYRFLQQKLAQKQPIKPEDQAWMKGYEKQKLLVPATSAQIRVEGFGNIRQNAVIDTKNNNSLRYMNSNEINEANAKEPGRYIPAGEGRQALTKTALMEDIRGNVQQVRASLQNEKMPEFDAAMRTKVAVALRDRDPRSAVSTLINSAAAGNLTPEQQDYLINTALLVENAMAMRSVLGAGQGSQDLREAIRATIPGPTTPSKGFALKQLDAFEKVLDRLERGVPSVPLRTVGGEQKSGQQKADPLGSR